MSPYIKYFKAVMRHKWYVFLEARKLGIPWLGLIHDLSKFLPSEFIAYSKQFYGDKLTVFSPDHSLSRGDIFKFYTEDPARFVVTNVDGANLTLAPLHRKSDFDYAWNHHQKSNKHHWQYWVLVYDDPEAGAEILLDMPKKYRLEMLADWRGAGQAYGNNDTPGWYAKHKHNQRVHPNVKAFLEEVLG